jgi:putative NIF3 family GTP cyclohydrolase 1 type 2
MDFHVFSRRNMMLVGLGTVAVQAAKPQGRAAVLTAGDVVGRIQKMVGIPWRNQTVDKIVAGGPDTPVTGIATTMMATLNVLERAAAAGANLVITHETPFYLHQDQTADLADDATYQFKLNFIREHRMAVFHFHDHWHARHPDGIAVGMMQELGWTQNADPQNPHRFTFSGVSLQDLARQMQSRLHIRTMRVIGDPKLPIRRALASWGYVSRMPGIPQFRESGVDVFIAGETREWELVEYVQDSITKGDRKALILLGHVVSEQAGMKYCAEWLRPFIPEVPVQFIAAPEPFWSPSEPIV